MKQISTLGFGILFSMAGFAAFSPSRLTVSTENNTVMKVTVDGSRFDQQSVGSSVVFENLQPGLHVVSVYQLDDRHSRFFGRRSGDDYHLVYSSSINIRPLFATSITFTRFGRAQVIEQPMRGDRRWGNMRSYGEGPDDYRQHSGYQSTISDGDFFAAERVMDRENDNGRLLYAKRLIDDNYLDAAQVKELARFFSFDDCRLDFVRYAYSKTIDKNNFRVVCAAFSSNEGRQQVERFINSCK